MSELKKLLPGEKYTTVSGEKIIVSPIPFGKTIDYVDAISAIMQRITGSGLNVATLLNKDSSIDTVAIFKVAFEEVVNLMSLVLGKPKEWFTESIDFSDGCALLEIIIRQNVDNERAKKNLKALTGRFSSLLQIPFKSSLAQAIAGQKSKDIQPERSNSLQKAPSSSEK
jgi:hypothetical protein